MSYESTIAEVRALAEGRAPKRVLLTMPMLDPDRPVPPALAAWEDLHPPRFTNPPLAGKRAARANTTALLAGWKNQTGDREFTTAEFADWAVENGARWVKPKIGAASCLQHAPASLVAKTNPGHCPLLWRFLQ